MLDGQPGTYLLTDFLVRSFERTVVRELGLDRWPELRDDYFAHYTRVVWLAQEPDPELRALAQQAADRLGLPLTVVTTGTGDSRPLSRTCCDSVRPVRIAVAGLGYVGLANAAILARHNHVTAVDIVEERVDVVNRAPEPVRRRRPGGERLFFIGAQCEIGVTPHA